MKNTISAADYENAWRPNFEMKAACWWGAGALGYAVYAAIGDFPSGSLLWMAGGCAALAAKSLVPGLRLMRTQLRLIGKPPATATFDELRKICSDPAHSNDMWLGRGFLWQPRHTQKIYDILRINYQETEESVLGGARKLLFLKHHPDLILHPLEARRRFEEEDKSIRKKGQTWIHGVGEKEDNLFQPLSHSEGHTLIIGTTGSGKAQPLTAKVLTPTGWRRMGDLAQGDFVLNWRGEPFKVAGIYDRGVREVWRIRTADERQTEACEEHLWTAWVTAPENVRRTPEGRSPALASLLDPDGRSGMREHMKRCGVPNVRPNPNGRKAVLLTTRMVNAFLHMGWRVEIPAYAPDMMRVSDGELFCGEATEAFLDGLEQWFEPDELAAAAYWLTGAKEVGRGDAAFEDAWARFRRRLPLAAGPQALDAEPGENPENPESPADSDDAEAQSGPDDPFDPADLLLLNIESRRVLVRMMMAIAAGRHPEAEYKLGIERCERLKEAWAAQHKTTPKVKLGPDGEPLYSYAREDAAEAVLRMYRCPAPQSRRTVWIPLRQEAGPLPVRSEKTPMLSMAGTKDVCSPEPDIISLAKELMRSVGIACGFEPVNGRGIWAAQSEDDRLAFPIGSLWGTLITEEDFDAADAFNGSFFRSDVLPLARVRIVSAEPTGNAVPMRCIRLADEMRSDALYVTDDYIVTHNTRCFDLLISQAIIRGESVIIIDPKGDNDLRQKAERACRELGRPEAFINFHPARPEESVRINLLANYTRPTEIASRIAALLPSQGPSDPFKSFSWGALNTICGGLCLAYKKPTLLTLRHYLEGSPEKMMLEGFEAYIRSFYGEKAGEAIIMRRYENLRKDTLSARVNALIEEYQENCTPSPEVDSLISLRDHDKEHFSKMITSLLPTLMQLTSGQLGKMLSPSEDELENLSEEFFDTGSFIDKNAVVYLGLDTLSDGMVGSAIGSLMLADLTSAAGSRYNFEGGGARTVNVFVDEAAEVVNDSFIQLLNKGRGAKIRLFVATQTIADFAARLGSREKATQVLGNLNQSLCLRCIDQDTQKYVASRFPKTRVRSVAVDQAYSTDADDIAAEGGRIGERLTETETPLIMPEILGMLPDLEYIASLSGGRCVKGRFPLLLKDASEFRR